MVINDKIEECEICGKMNILCDCEEDYPQDIITQSICECGHPHNMHCHKSTYGAYCQIAGCECDLYKSSLEQKKEESK